MGIQTYSAQYWNGSTYVTLTNVQSIDIMHGRHRQLDAYQAARCTVVLRYPNGYSSPITQLVPGERFRVENVTGAAQRIFVGLISDVEVQYGIPYAGGVGPADYLTITVEGNFARASRVAGNDYSMAQGSVEYQRNQMDAASGLVSYFNFMSGFDPILSANTVSASWGEWVNQVLTTINGRMWDAYDPFSFQLLGPYLSQTCGFNFSDTTNDATNQVYDQISFASYADNYYTQVTVDPLTLAPVTVTAAGASTPYRTLQTNTLNSSTNQATDYARYLLNNYSTTNPKIVSVSCSAESQNSFQLDKCGAPVPLLPLVNGGPTTAAGNRVAVTFRGTTVQCVIEGVAISATPAGSRYTFYLSGADLNAYLILNDAVFGKLNENKLGY